ncbi:hypothetical protein DITRI_Ditri17bG0028000 [Diplodiscus trichospermus]
MGVVEDIDTSGINLAWGKSLPVKVAVNITKLIKRGCLINVLRKGKTLVYFRYKKLPDFFYSCGRLDYQEYDYMGSNLNSKALYGFQCEYGLWLRVKGPKLSLVEFENLNCRIPGASSLSNHQSVK